MAPHLLFVIVFNVSANIMVILDLFSLNFIEAQTAVQFKSFQILN